jgi:hypothetical protein
MLSALLDKIEENYPDSFAPVMLPMVEVLTPYVDVKLVPLPPTKHIFKKGWASSIVLQILFLSWAFMIWSWLPILLLLFILVVDLVLWK